MFKITLFVLALNFQSCTPKKLVTQTFERSPSSQTSVLDTSVPASTIDEQRSAPQVVSCPVAPVCPSIPQCPSPPPTPPIAACPEPVPGPSRPASSTLPNCVFTIEGVHPVAIGGSITEKILCTYLPVGSVVRLVDSNDSTESKSQIISVSNNVPFSRQRTNRGRVSASDDDIRIYSMRVEVYDANQNALFHTQNIKYGMSGLADPSAIRCVLNFVSDPSSGNIVKFGEPIRERVYCSNLNEFSEVRFIRTKNGVESFNQSIAVANKYDTPFQTVLDSRGDYYYDRPYELYDSSDKAGKYTSQIVIKDRRNGQILYRSEIVNYELLPGS